MITQAKRKADQQKGTYKYKICVCEMKPIALLNFSLLSLNFFFHLLFSLSFVTHTRLCSSFSMYLHLSHLGQDNKILFRSHFHEDLFRSKQVFRFLCQILQTDFLWKQITFAQQVMMIIFELMILDKNSFIHFSF